MAACSVGRGTHSVLTVKLKRSEPFGRPPLQWHMDCCKLQFQNVFWSRGPKDVGLLPSARNALSAATRRQIPICRLAAFGRFKEMQERKLSLRTRLGAGTGFVKDNSSLCPLMRGFSACRTKCFYSSCVLLPISYYQRQFLQYQQNKKWAAPVRLQMLPIEIML